MSVRLDHGEDTPQRGARDQRHAVHRRDAGAAHHLHGGGAARHRRHRGQPAGIDRRAAAAARQAGLPDGKADLTLALGNDPVPRDLLRNTLDAATKGDKDTRIFLRADKTVPYGEMMEVMNLLRKAGYLKVALVGLEKAPGP